MFKWFRRQSEKNGAEIEEIGWGVDLDRLLNGELVVVFKHSTACPVSWAAHAHVVRFHKHHPDVPMYLVPVIQQRPLSRQIAERTDVWHESPQIIVLRNGRVVDSLSHGEITESQIEELVEKAATPTRDGLEGDARG